MTGTGALWRHEQGSAGELDALRRALASERAERARVEAELRGTREELRDAYSVLQNAEGADSMLRREIQDHRQTMRELARARDQAMRASERKSEFVSQLSHEFRTPLTAILGYAEIMLEDLEGGVVNAQDLQQDIEAIRTSGGHMLELINELLDLAKIESGSSPLLLETFSVPTLLEQLFAALKPLVKDGQEFKFRCDTRVGVMVTDRIKLRQILTNLLSNALKFTPEGSVKLTVRCVGDAHLRFDVEDTGIGMTEEALGRVFEAFEQAEATTKRDYGGTGLGLTLCRKLTDMLGGQLRVRSTPGKGTVFSLLVPQDRTA